MEIKTSKGVNYVNADYTIEEKQGEYPKLTCTIPASKNKIWIDDCKELDRLYTPGEQDEFVIINPVKITKGASYDLEITAVGAFEFDFVKSRIDDNLPTRYYTVEYLLDLVFKDTRYSYDLQGTYEKREFTNFGSDNRYKLFLQIMNRFNLEFKVIGKIVRINSKIGNDTGFQFRYLKNIKDTKYSVDATNLVTHIKGYGAYHDVNDQSKGRLEVEYLSPLSDIYGELSGEPVVDERMSISATLLEKCKQSVESSVAVTVSTTLVALKNQEYRGVARVGDSIWFIDERIELEKKIRFSTVKSYYDAFDELIKQDVQLGDKDVFSRAQSSDSASQSKLIDMQKELSDQLADVENAIKKTYVMPSGVNRVFYSSDLPEDVPKGTIKEGDTLFRNIDGETKMYRWDGVQWELVPVVNDVEKFREELDNEIAQVTQSMQAQAQEHDRQVADILSKTQSVESLANQVKSDAASALARANQVKTEAIADARAQVATVSQALNTAKTELQSAIASADQKARDSQASATALRNDLNSQANKILAQAQAQTALTNRVTTVETLADGTRSTVAELSKTVSKATGDIASVSSRTKTVEDTLSQTRTQYEALSQTVNAQTGQIDSINRKTADLQSGIDGVRERFENLRVGGENLLLNAGFENAVDRAETFTVAGVTYTNKSLPHWGNLYNGGIQNPTTSFHAIFRENFEGIGPVIEFNESDGSRNWKAIDARLRPSDIKEGNYTFSTDVYATGTGTKIWFGFYYYNKSGVRNFHSGLTTVKVATVNIWHRISGAIRLKNDIDLTKDIRFYIYAYNFESNSILYLTKPKLENGTVATAFSLAQETIRSEIAEYKRTAEESSAELSRQIQLADGKAVEAKTYAQQTADVIKTRLESLETYKDGESTRASQYLSASRTETAKQITAERTAIANNYVAKSTYDENVRGTTLKLNEIKTTADTAKRNLATYQNTVDRKLEELTSSTQTLDGKINTASSKVDTVAGQIRTEIGTVEAKIPTENGGTNLIIGSMTRLPTPYQQASLIFTKNQSVQEWQATDAVRVQGTKGSSNSFCYLSTGRSIQNSTSGIRYVHSIYIKNTGAPFQISNNLRKTIDIATGETKRVAIFDVGIDARYLQIVFQQPGTGQLDFYYWHPQIETGTIVNDWSPAPEDLINEISSVKTTITQTASGVEQLSTSLATTDNKVSTAEANIRNLINEVSSKVSQTDYNTLTGRVDSAETAITQNATEISKRLTSTQVESAITDKGYQTKSDVDSNITGRGYITNAALQPYALSTTVQTLVKETADSFSRTISETKALIPTEAGGTNLVRGSAELKQGSQGWSQGHWRSSGSGGNVEYNVPLPSSPIKGITTGAKITSDSSNQIGLCQDGTSLEAGTYTLSVWVLGSSGFKVHVSSAYSQDTKNPYTAGNKFVTLQDSSWTLITQTFTLTKRYSNLTLAYLMLDSPGTVYYAAPYIHKSTLLGDWSPAPEDLATVTALHNVTDTVDSHTRTIGAVGETGSILDNVSKVTQTANGLVTEVSGTNGLKTQVSTLAGSYAIKNLTKAGDVLGQINLNKDGSVKIDGSLVQITGKTYIQDGVITSAKIGKGQIGTAHIGEIDAGIAKIINLDVSNVKGLDAEFIKAKIENAFIEWMKGKTITAQNEAMTIGLNDAFIRFKDNAKIEFQSENNTLYRTKNGTSAFIHFRDDSYNGVYTAMGVNADNTGTQNDYSSGSFAGVRVIRSNPSRYSGTTVDQVQLVGDEIRIRHGYGYENDYLVIKWDNQGKIDLIKFLRSVASKLGLPLT